jgi:hypothetical protein
MKIVIWYVENVIGNVEYKNGRGLTHLYPSPPLLNNFPKVYITSRENAQNYGVEIDTRVKIVIKGVKIDTKNIWKFNKKVVFYHMYNRSRW